MSNKKLQLLLFKRIQTLIPIKTIHHHFKSFLKINEIHSDASYTHLVAIKNQLKSLIELTSKDSDLQLLLK